MRQHALTPLTASPSVLPAQAFTAKLLEAGVAGVANLGGTALGVLFPLQHPQAPQIVLNMMVVPSAKGA